MLTANVYGYCQGPTWPEARAMTNALMSDVTREVVLGRRGIRLICGDWNHSADSLDEVAIWKSLGWADVQDLAHDCWNVEIQMTCKASTRRDFIFLSPEAAACLKQARVSMDFPDHATLIAGLQLPQGNAVVQTWPLPSEIPWSQVNLDTWKACPVPASRATVDSSSWLRDFSRQFERSLDGHVMGTRGSRLPKRCKGRAARTSPRPQEVPAVPPKPSRPEKEVLRNDSLSLEVKRWYQQLRRFQSLLHAAKAGKMHAAAVEYRLTLWQTIKSSTGFVGGFSAWWSSRQVKHPHAPSSFPLGLPPAAVIQVLFYDFRDNFRRFEAWSIRQRTAVLTARHEQQRDLVFRDLRGERPQQVDTLVLQHTYAILAVDDQTRSVHVDEPVDCRGHSTWSCDGMPCEVIVQEDQTCQVPQLWSLTEQHELVQTVVLSDVRDIHSEFEKLWSPRWNRQQNVSASDWQRITAFACAYLPSRPWHLSSITLSQWRTALKRFKPRAARGVDGFAKADLLHLDDHRTLQLLGLFTEIELGEKEWPAQWLVGLVCSLAKPNGRQDANGFRPISIFTIAYRTWSSIRAKQLLRWLSSCVPATALGFLPQKETKMFWWCIEALVESAVQAGDPLTGFCTDIVKAFNCLPRDPILEVARCMGAPARVLDPWRGFLQNATRRFVIRGCVSAAVASTNGFAEGCPLSPVAMVITDCIWHTYLQVFQPRVLPFSYVDNFTCLAETVGDLAGGINCTRAFVEMMKLELDEEKTYVWGLGKAVKDQLAQLRVPQLSQVKELGGCFAFGASIRNSEVVSKCRNLDSVFALLKRSRSPTPYKLASLPAKFWSSALHAISGCPLGDVNVVRLRTQAVKALGQNPAGASPLLTLTLSAPMTADPGFYQLWTCLTDARRMLQRCPSMLPVWQSFMQAFDGQIRHGPFAKLVQVLSQVGWRIGAAPWLQDHWGFDVNLLACPLAFLRRRAEAAWLGFVGKSHQHRTTMSDLDGIDPALLRISRRGLSALNVARTRALQSGAFITGASKSRFDLAQLGKCALCNVADTQQHRVCDCPAFQEARQAVSWISTSWPLLPSCLTHHLLAPFNPFVQGVLGCLQGLADVTACFLSGPADGELQHVFTDGSCFQHENPDLALAAWGVVNANNAKVVSCGELSGQFQTTPRAELAALLSALRWVAKYHRPTTIWTDALNQVQVVRALLDGHALPDHLDNADLWRRIADAVVDIGAIQVWVQHTPGHLQQQRCQSPFEEWLAQWNNHVDVVARLTNMNRSVQLQEQTCRAKQWHDQMKKAQAALQHMYLHIAASVRPMETVQEDDGIAADSPLWIFNRDHLPRWELLSEAIVVDGWQRFVSACGDIPAQFVQSIGDFLIGFDSQSEETTCLTCLELVFLFREYGGCEFPAQCPTSGKWLLCSELAFKPRPLTVAVQLRLIRQVARVFFRSCGLADRWVDGVDLLLLGVHSPQVGFRIGYDAVQLSKARQDLRSFTANRPVRTVADLARPFLG